MEELSVFGLVAKTLASARVQPVPEAGLFENVFTPRYRWWRGFFPSLSLHVFFIFVLLPLTALLPESDEEAWRQHARILQPLQLRIPDRLYLSSPGADSPPPQAKPKPKVQPPAPKELAKSGNSSGSTGAALRTPPRQFRLPDVAKRPFRAQTLIQPDLPPDLELTVQVRLPQLFLTASALPRPVPRRFVKPGPSPPPNLAPGKLEAPPEIVSASETPQDILIATMLTGPERAMLRLPRPTSPVKVFRPPSSGGSGVSGRGTSISPTLGEPVSVVAYSANPAPLTDNVLIPLGNQLGRLPGPPPSTDPAAPVGIPVGGGGATGSAGTGLAGSGSGSGTGRGAGLGAGAGTGNGKGAGTGNGTGAGGAGSGPGDGPGGTGSGGGGGGSGNDGALAMNSGRATPVLNYTAPIRIEHPANGVFDVVVSQASIDESLPESAGVLSGRPVYTVYVQAGAPRTWLLQYCIPKDVDEGPKVVGATVYIGKPSPLKAPFPLVSVLPPVTMLPRTTYIMVHGFVDKAGQFKDLNVLRAPDDGVKELLLPHLLQWHFRPATRDGVPTLVEILLAIPPQES